MKWAHLFGRRRKKDPAPVSDLIAIVDDTVDPRLVVSRDPTGPLAEQYRFLSFGDAMLLDRHLS